MNPREYIGKIWQKETVWPGNAGSISQRLGWLNCVDEFEPRCSAIEAFAKTVPYSNVVLLGMGGSSLVSRVFLHTISHPRRKFHVLDTTDPSSILSVQKSISLNDTLFIAASKSGTTIEVECLLDYFYELRPHPEQFIAITDFNTSLMRKAEKLHFRHLFVNPSDIGGRFAALSYFGLVPLAFMGGDVKNFLACAKDVVRKCKSPEKNPALELANFLFKGVSEGQNKLTFLSTASLSSLPLWIEQLIAESTGKQGKGILPVLENPADFSKWKSKDRMYVAYQTSNENLECKNDLEKVPCLFRSIRTFNDLAREFFIWEFATALLGAMLEINPFDEPDVVNSKKNTLELLQQIDSVSSEINKKCITMDECQKFFQTTSPQEFIGILSFASPSKDGTVQKLRKDLDLAYDVPVFVSTGPGYLHSTGQYYKGGTNQGRYVVVVDEQKELAIPGRKYGFQTLKLAQALGDYQALTKADRKVCMVKI